MVSEQKAYVLDRAALAIRHVGANDNCHPMLARVAIRNGKAYATDGFVIARADLMEANDHTPAAAAIAADALVPVSVAAAIASKAERLPAITTDNGTLSRLEDPVAWFSDESGNRIEWRQFGTTIGVDIPDAPGNWPDGDSILSTSGGGPSIALNPKLLITAMKVIDQFTKAGDMMQVCHIELPKDGKPNAVQIRAQRYDGRRITIAIMPMIMTRP